MLVGPSKRKTDLRNSQYRVVRVLGTVYGMTVRTRNWAAGIGMGLKSMVGGELKWFTNMVSGRPARYLL